MLTVERLGADPRHLAKPSRISRGIAVLNEVDDTVTHRTFMDVTIGGRKMGRVVFGLYGNAYPKTCEISAVSARARKESPSSARVRSLAGQAALQDTTFFRVVPGFVWGGDITHHPQNLGHLDLRRHLRRRGFQDQAPGRRVIC